MEGKGLLGMSQVEVAMGTNEQRPRFAGGTVSSSAWLVPGQRGKRWLGSGLEHEGHQLPDCGLGFTRTATGESQRFPSRDGARRKGCVRKTRALDLEAVWRIGQRQGETGDR